MVEVIRGSLCLMVLLGVGGTRMRVHVRSGTAVAAATCDCCTVRLLATSEQHDIYINERYSTVSTRLSGAALSLFFHESRDSLRKATLSTRSLNEDLCHALATMSRLDVEVEIRYCRLADDAAGSFIECLHSDRGPVTLDQCEIGNHIIAHAVSGNSRVTKLKLYRERNDIGMAVYNADMAILFAVLANNRGLVDLNMHGNPISNDNWSLLCEVLKTHPTLTSPNLINTRESFDTEGFFRMGLTDGQKAYRTCVLAETMKENTVLHTIKLSQDGSDEEIYTQMILPYLETNRYRTRAHAIKKADIPLRRPLLGLALQTESVRNDSNLRWMFLSGNPDVVI
jgi:hypothetical protein